MTQKKKLYKGVSCAVWGCLFLHVDITVGTINLTPEFAAYLLFLVSISCLQEEVRDFVLLRPLGILLAAWTFLQSASVSLGIEFTSQWQAIPLIMKVVKLYFDFQLITDFAILAAQYQPTKSNIAHRLRRWRNVQTVLETVLSISILGWSSKAVWEYWHFIPVLLGVVTSLSLMAALIDLKGVFDEDA